MSDDTVSVGERTWQQVERGATLLIPLGSTEQHGPHLPLDTDSRIADSIARSAAAITGAVVAPVLPYGASGEHGEFSGTLSLGAEALRVALVELVRSATTAFARVVLVNGHGGNQTAVSAAVRQLLHEGHDVTSWAPRIAGSDAHAGRTETSLMLAIAPSLVRQDLAEPGNVAALVDLMPTLRKSGVIAVSANGVLGDPTGATAAEGRELLDRLIVDLVQAISSGE